MLMANILLLLSVFKTVPGLPLNPFPIVNVGFTLPEGVNFSGMGRMPAEDNDEEHNDGAKQTSATESNIILQV